MDPSLVPAKVIGGMLALPVRAELTPSGQWHLAIPRPFIADISLDACGCAFRPGLHFDRGVIGKNGLVRYTDDGALDSASQGELEYGQKCERPGGTSSF